MGRSSPTSSLAGEQGSVQLLPFGPLGALSTPLRSFNHYDDVLQVLRRAEEACLAQSPALLA